MVNNLVCLLQNMQDTVQAPAPLICIFNHFQYNAKATDMTGSWPSTSRALGITASQRFAMQVAYEEPDAGREQNLLDLDELAISEPSPATNASPSPAANGFGDAASSQPSPAGAQPDAALARPSQLLITMHNMNSHTHK